MAENTRGQVPDRNRNREESRPNENLKGTVSNQQSSSDRSGSSGLDEKSSTMGRRDKGRGLATKDGVTGSDYDGQITE